MQAIAWLDLPSLSSVLVFSITDQAILGMLHAYASSRAVLSEFLIKPLGHCYSYSVYHHALHWPLLLRVEGADRALLFSTQCLPWRLMQNMLFKQPNFGQI